MSFGMCKVTTNTRSDWSDLRFIRSDQTYVCYTPRLRPSWLSHGWPIIKCMEPGQPMKTKRAFCRMTEFNQPSQWSPVDRHTKHLQSCFCFTSIKRAPNQWFLVVSSHKYTTKKEQRNLVKGKPIVPDSWQKKMQRLGRLKMPSKLTQTQTTHTSVWVHQITISVTLLSCDQPCQENEGI